MNIAPIGISTQATFRANKASKAGICGSGVKSKVCEMDKKTLAVTIATGVAALATAAFFIIKGHKAAKAVKAEGQKIMDEVVSIFGKDNGGKVALESGNRVKFIERDGGVQFIERKGKEVIRKALKNADGNLTIEDFANNLNFNGKKWVKAKTA